MKLLLGLLISFFLVFFASSRDLSGVGDGHFRLDKKTVVNNSRLVTPQNIIQKKQLHPAGDALEFFNVTPQNLLNQNGFLSNYNCREISNFISSGAKIYQQMASA
ncbi:hypothetical protein [Peredibacter starrii]|uniref:Uncharacterized protein n=1 Tax=Peredibacter starrii TaxID=28202 RepID=A0AAX4HJJ2_9BACT|nr:hypothetical protein [Peredibacter starrii]WPU63387.1 hypothetical protein SOO65_11885 [Peredibacter starrii]